MSFKRNEGIISISNILTWPSFIDLIIQETIPYADVICERNKGYIPLSTVKLSAEVSIVIVTIIAIKFRSLINF